MDFLTWLSQNILSPVFWFQPLFYTVHGWLATEMALWMLFHPYEPHYFPLTKTQIPFTPGIFPRGRKNLSISIADMVTNTLVTPKDIKRQAEKLITEDNIYTALDVLLSSITHELQDINHIRRIYHYVDQFVPQFLAKLLQDGIAALERGEVQQFEYLLDQILTRLLPHLKLGEAQAEFIASLVFNTLVKPAYIREVLIEALTDENIAVFEEMIKARIGGLQGLLLKFLDLQKGFQSVKSFLIEQPQEAEELILQMVDRMELREKLAHQLLQFSPSHLPLETLSELKQVVSHFLQGFLISHQLEITTSITSLSHELTHSMTHSLLKIDYQEWAAQHLPGFKRDVAAFINTYLHKELEHMLSRALPAISMNTVIIEKIDQFSAQELEETIQRICHRELRWLAFLGAFLGFWLGLMSNLLAYWWHPTFR